MVRPNVDSSKPLDTIRAVSSPSPKQQPVGNDGKSNANDKHDLNTDRQQGANAPMASTKASALTKDAQSTSKGKGNTKSTRKVTNHINSNSNNRQVETAPAINSKASKSNHSDTTEGITSDLSHSKAGGRQSFNSKTSSSKAAGSTGAKSLYKPAAVEAAGISLLTCAWQPVILCLVYVPGMVC